jgi:hypothetical protein
MKIALPLFIALSLLSAAPALAADDRESAGKTEDGYGIWGFDEQASSASLARDGWKFQAMSTLSWPDGRQAVVTMWVNQLGDFARCFDYFDAKMVQTGGKCERSGTGL